MRGRKRYHPPKKSSHKNTSWITVAFLCCAFLGLVYIGLFGLNFQNPLHITTGSSDYPVSDYQGAYRVGSIATDQSGTKGLAIVNNAGSGKYEVIEVYLDQSKKGWHTNGPTNREWLNYNAVEQQYPLLWPGGIMDITHIPDKDWSLPENWKSGRGTGVNPQSSSSWENANSDSGIQPSASNADKSTVNIGNADSNIQMRSVNVDPTIEILNRHNYYRNSIPGIHIPNLVWSSTIAASAQSYANYLGTNNLFEHSKSSQYGENLAAGYPSWTSAIDGWGSEQSNFIYASFGNGASKNGNWADVGHYTQVIWSTTTQCGCGSAPHATYGTVYVCQYSPAGNIVGYYPY
jgi:uncharacterized protein YkwD